LQVKEETMTSRRAFLGSVGLTILGTKAARAGATLDWAATPAPAHHRSFSGPFGIQLYSLRHQLGKDVPGTLKYIRESGYTDVETAGFYGMSPADFKKELDKAGLKCTAMHAGDDNRFRDKLDEIIAEAKVFKPDYVNSPWVQEPHRKDAEGCKRVAADFNEWGKKLQAAGFRFAFHNHDAEFRPMGNTTAMDIFIQETDPSLVDFQLDLFYAKKVGLVPAEYLRKYAGRFKLVHMKDISKSTPTGFEEAPDDSNVPLGEGQIDWPKTLAAAAETGVKYYYVEDESETAPEGIRKSYQYLKTVRF
jgi:sugar phosphate isomerase/epimerase